MGTGDGEKGEEGGERGGVGIEREELQCNFFLSSSVAAVLCEEQADKLVCLKCPWLHIKR